jgi:hypothetical protein
MTSINMAMPTFGAVCANAVIFFTSEITETNLVNKTRR